MFFLWKGEVLRGCGIKGMLYRDSGLPPVSKDRRKPIPGPLWVPHPPTCLIDTNNKKNIFIVKDSQIIDQHVIVREVSEIE